MGKPADARQHARALRIYRLREDGCTTREIADLVGVKPEQVKPLAQLGERLASETPATPKDHP
jgi:prolyl-tRNA editing enzyme YbaK/EbsC (Cys-tRNA(Pro) deacylase)